MSNWNGRTKDYLKCTDGVKFGEVTGEKTGKVDLCSDSTAMVLVADRNAGIVVYINKDAMKPDTPDESNRKCSKVYPGCGLHVTPVEGSQCYDVEDNLGNSVRICP